MRQAEEHYGNCMVRRAFRFGLVMGVFGGLAWALRRTFDLRRATEDGTGSGEPWAPILESARPGAPEAKTEPKPEPASRATPPEWIEPNGTICPTSHPIKAKLASGLFHAPGMLAYNRTRPDRCYSSESAAIADGFTKAKR
jgi:micrococcal nuclease